MSWFPHKNVENTLRILNEWIYKYQNEDVYNWAIIYNGKLIGNISVTDYMKKDEKCEISFCIGKAW